MNDHSVSIVLRQSHIAGNRQKASHVLQWLIDRDVVSADVTDFTLGNPGYSVSAGAVLVVKSPDDLPYDSIINGSEIVVDRKVFITGENFVEVLICPKCHEDIAFQD